METIGKLSKILSKLKRALRDPYKHNGLLVREGNVVYIDLLKAYFLCVGKHVEYRCGKTNYDAPIPVYYYDGYISTKIDYQDSRNYYKILPTIVISLRDNRSFRASMIDDCIENDSARIVHTISYDEIIKINKSYNEYVNSI